MDSVMKLGLAEVGCPSCVIPACPMIAGVSEQEVEFTQSPRFPHIPRVHARRAVPIHAGSATYEKT